MYEIMFQMNIKSLAYKGAWIYLIALLITMTSVSAPA